MKRIIWTCWFQGQDFAPKIVKRCLNSWVQKNPDWDFRCLDAYSVREYIDLSDLIDLRFQSITAASLSDIIRIHLLHEYGGVWVDATLFCNRPLDEWLPEVSKTGFFAFNAPAPGRPLSSWFLAAVPQNMLVDRWTAYTRAYWKDRQSSDNYFWFHTLFGKLCEADESARQEWEAVPKWSADDPHALQRDGIMYKPVSDVVDKIDLSTPVFKLTYRLDSTKLSPGNFLSHLLNSDISPADYLAQEESGSVDDNHRSFAVQSFASLKVSTDNLGDHIQIIGAAGLLARLGVRTSFEVDRDDEIASAESLQRAEEPVGILLNGWFKRNRKEWPPHPNLVPIFLGFHIRLFQCPELLSNEALEYYRKFQPIGCRDAYTQSLLSANGIDAFESNCLSLLFSRRICDHTCQTDIFVVSRDRNLLDCIPDSLGEVIFVDHYTGSTDFEVNMERAYSLLHTYKSRAKLIVTSLLHCALPAIAMGIPVIVFYPTNNKTGHASDRERFSSLEKLVRVYHRDESAQVDWGGEVVDVSDIKLALVDSFFEMASRWSVSRRTPLGPIAPSSALPVYVHIPVQESIDDPDRLRLLANALMPDQKKWGDSANYKAAWRDRSVQAAKRIPDGVKVLEIGVGTGFFRDIVRHRCRYEGADLVPLDNTVMALDLEVDSMPENSYDFIVILGVLEYIHTVDSAVRKICMATDNVVVTYCCIIPGKKLQDRIINRRKKGWVNDLDFNEFVHLFAENDFKLSWACDYNDGSDFKQIMMQFSRCREIVNPNSEVESMRRDTR